MIDWIADDLGIAREQIVAIGSVMLIISLFMAVASLLLIPWVLVRLPPNYLRRDYDRLAEGWRRRHPLLRWTIVLAKNVLGVVLIVVGFVMLVLPGQGVVTVFVGIMLTDFPGKRTLERKTLGNRHVLKWVNRLRHRAGKPPLETG